MKLPPGEFYYNFKKRLLIWDQPPVNFSNGREALTFVCGTIAGLEWSRTGRLEPFITVHSQN